MNCNFRGELNMMFKKIFKKAQGATEYLIILAVVIIIALIVVAALGGIPGIGGGAKKRASNSFWQTADIAVPSFSVSTATDIINLTVRNNLRNSVSSLTANAGGATLTCGQTSLSPGQETWCDGAGGSVSCGAVGDAYAYKLGFTYTDDDTSASYNANGQGQKLEGVCAS